LAGAEIDAELSDLLAQASDTELDSFYPSEILDEKFVREQRQYLIRWEVSVRCVSCTGVWPLERRR
jgi:hypothetical protein